VELVETLIAITIPGMGDHDAPESVIRIERNE
jgi:hypothetical protein